MNRFYFLPMLVLFSQLSGCTLHEVTTSPVPDLAVPDTYYDTSTAEVSSLEPWWLDFQEPELNQLIQRALTENFEIKQGLSRLIQAESLRRQARADLYPQLSAGAGSRHDWDQDGDYDSQSTIGGSLAWELDFFGRLRSQVLTEEYLEKAAAASAEEVRLAVSEAVARAFFSAIEQREKLRLLKNQLTTDQELLTLVRLRFQHGVASKVDILQQQSQVHEVEALIPLAEAELRVAENSLDVLLGIAPDGLPRVSPDARFPSREGQVGRGVPSDLLERRPDLRRLQAEVVAADADIARSVAERWPVVQLSGSSFFAVGSGSAGAVSQVLLGLIQPILDWGRRAAEVRRTDARFQEALAAYAQGFLRAVAEVENQFYRLGRQRAFLDVLSKRKRVLEETVAETQQRYTSGLTDYLPVLDAIKELRRVEREEVNETRALLNTRTSLLVALGGAMPAVEPKKDAR